MIYFDKVFQDMSRFAHNFQIISNKNKHNFKTILPNKSKQQGEE